MSDVLKITLPLSSAKTRELKAGMQVLLNGSIYSCRDAAHKRFIESIQKGIPLPFPMTNQTIYYMGPTPCPPGEMFGAAGPTSSYRMDTYSPELIKAGLTVMIGKGKRSPEVIEMMKQYGAVYLVTVGGAAALTAKSIIKAEQIAYEDLGTEAVYKLEIQNFSAIVAIDSFGNNAYEIGRKQFMQADL